MTQTPHKPDPLQLINALKQANPRLIEEIYTRGGCFALYKALKVVYNDAVCYYDQVEGHVYTKIGSKYYDIRGSYDKITPRAFVFETEPRIMEQADEWRYTGTKI